MTRRSGSPSRGQSGQILLLTALMMTVLIGFAGLALDYGIGAMNERQAQNAVDAATLGAAYDLGTGATEAVAQAKAQQLALANGFSAAEITLSFLDSSGAPTGNASQVATVSGLLKHTTPTILLRALKINTQTESATGAATVGGGSGGCVICVLDGSAFASLLMWNLNDVTVTGGGVAVDSNSGFAALLFQLNNVSTPSFTVVGSAVVLNVNQFNPMPQNGATAVADPLLKAPVPSCPSGNPYSRGSKTFSNTNSVTVLPGTYTSLTVTNANSVTLSPGIYCIAGTGLSISNVSSLTADGVLIYLTCGTWPNSSACSPHQTGAVLTVANLSGASFSGPTSGLDQGIVIFADRNNIATQSFSNATLSKFTGTMYAPTGNLTFDNFTSATPFNSMIVADTLSVSNGTDFDVAYTAALNYPVGGLPALTQ